MTLWDEALFVFILNFFYPAISLSKSSSNIVSRCTIEAMGRLNIFIIIVFMIRACPDTAWLCTGYRLVSRLATARVESFNGYSATVYQATFHWLASYSTNLKWKPSIYWRCRKKLTKETVMLFQIWLMNKITKWGSKRFPITNKVITMSSLEYSGIFQNIIGSFCWIIPAGFTTDVFNKVLCGLFVFRSHVILFSD